jgi:hypothetical protein
VFLTRDDEASRKGESRLTVMLDSFFGIHPWVVRSGLWAKLKPGEVNLYIYLLEESERRCTRQLTVTDEEVRTVGTAPRTLCNARKKLQEYGLIHYKRGEGNKYTYTICNPKTREPYPGNPREPMVVPKRSRSQDKDSAKVTASLPTPAPKPLSSKPEARTQRKEPPLETHGLPGVFSKSGG